MERGGGSTTRVHPAEPSAAADAFQRPLRSRFQARLSASVRCQALGVNGKKKIGSNPTLTLVANSFWDPREDFWLTGARRLREELTTCLGCPRQKAPDHRGSSAGSLPRRLAVLLPSGVRCGLSAASLKRVRRPGGPSCHDALGGPCEPRGSPDNGRVGTTGRAADEG